LIFVEVHYTILRTRDIECGIVVVNPLKELYFYNIIIEEAGQYNEQKIFVWGD